MFNAVLILIGLAVTKTIQDMVEDEGYRELYCFCEIYQ